jgi:hypothetical protein
MGGNLKKQLAPLALLLMLIVAVSIPAIADDSDQGVSDPSPGYTNASDPVNVTSVDSVNVSTDLPGDVISDDNGTYNVTDGEPINTSDGSGAIAPVDYTVGYYGATSCEGAADNVKPACTGHTAAVNTITNSSCSNATKKTCNKSSAACNKTK